MEPISKLPSKTEVVLQAKNLKVAGADIESIIKFLRSQGLEKSESIKCLCSITGDDLRSTALVVHKSDAWADRRLSDEESQEHLFKALEMLGFEDVDMSTLNKPVQF